MELPGGPHRAAASRRVPLHDAGWVGWGDGAWPPAYRARRGVASPAGTEVVALERTSARASGSGMADDLHALFAPLGRLAHEMAALAYLDAGARLLGMRHLSGATGWLQLPVRLVVRDALAFDARAVVVAHNHPSGRAEASPADLAFTRRLASCLDALEVRLHDHLVLAGDRVTSLRAEGYL